MGLFACVASVLASAKWHYVAWDGTWTVWGGKCSPVIHVRRVEKSQNGPVTHGATALEVVEGEQPIIGGIVSGEHRSARSSSLPSHLLHEGVSACTLRIRYALPATVVVSAIESIRANGKFLVALLAFDYRAIVERVAFSNVVFGKPTTETLSVAKVAMLIKCPGDYAKFLTALPARCLDAVVIRAILASQILGSPLSHTGVAAKVILPPFNQTGLATKFLSTLSALNISAAVSIAVLARVEPLVAGVGALLATVVLLLAAELTQFARKRFSAFSTNKLSSPNRFGLTLTGFAPRCKAVFFGFVALKVLGRSGKMLLAKVALLKLSTWGIMGLHEKFTFLLPSPGVLEHRQGNYFPALIIPQGAGK